MFKVIFTSLTLFVVGMLLFFFGFSDSYKYSMEARMKYFMGDYEKARELAKKAFDLDPYNKMAFSILSQSKISAQMADYVKEADKYLQKIEQLTNKSDFSQRDKLKIKLITEIMMEKFNKLNPTVLTDKELYAECIKRYEKFKTLHERLFKIQE
jgi:tetratricopeptide (TPR) repeat protein